MRILMGQIDEEGFILGLLHELDGLIGEEPRVVRLIKGDILLNLKHKT